MSTREAVPDPPPPDRYDAPVSTPRLEVVPGGGRDAAFDELYRSEHLAMLRLAFLLTSDRESAAEIAQEAFVRTYERWDRLDNPGGYLRTAVVNRCNDHHRRRVRRATRLVAHVEDRAVRDPDDVLADVIASLKPRQRAAIVLRYYLDLPQSEIAEVLGVRQGTVKSLLHRALASLRDALEEPPGPDGRAAPPPDRDDHTTTNEDRR